MSAMPAFVDLAAIAAILAELGDDIEHLGATLCTDPAIAANHIEALQAIDLIAQKQRGLASFLGAECPVSASATLGLEALKARLRPVGGEWVSMAGLPAAEPSADRG